MVALQKKGAEDTATRLRCQKYNNTFCDSLGAELSGNRTSPTGYSICILRWGLWKKREWNGKLGRGVTAERDEAKQNQHKALPSISIHASQLVTTLCVETSLRANSVTEGLPISPAVSVRKGHTNTSTCGFLYKPRPAQQIPAFLQVSLLLSFFSAWSAPAFGCFLNTRSFSPQSPSRQGPFQLPPQPVPLLLLKPHSRSHLSSHPRVKARPLHSCKTSPCAAAASFTRNPLPLRLLGTSTLPSHLLENAALESQKKASLGTSTLISWDNSCSLVFSC